MISHVCFAFPPYPTVFPVSGVVSQGLDAAQDSQWSRQQSNVCGLQLGEEVHRYCQLRSNIQTLDQLSLSSPFYLLPYQR